MKEISVTLEFTEGNIHQKTVHKFETPVIDTGYMDFVVVTFMNDLKATLEQLTDAYQEIQNLHLEKLNEEP